MPGRRGARSGRGWDAIPPRPARDELLGELEPGDAERGNVPAGRRRGSPGRAASARRSGALSSDDADPFGSEHPGSGEPAEPLGEDDLWAGLDAEQAAPGATGGRDDAPRGDVGRARAGRDDEGLGDEGRDSAGRGDEGHGDEGRDSAGRGYGSSGGAGRGDGIRGGAGRRFGSRGGAERGDDAGGGRGGGARGRRGPGQGRFGGRKAEEDGPPRSESEVAREICLRQLAVRPRTRAELAKALAKREISDEVIAEVLDRYDEVGMIDDAAFARAWVSSRHQGRGLARRALANELRQRGVDAEVAGAALEAVDDESEAATARALVDRKLRTVTGAPDAVFRRLVGMLARKGYPAGTAYRVVKEALAARDAEAAAFAENIDADALADE